MPRCVDPAPTSPHPLTPSPSPSPTAQAKIELEGRLGALSERKRVLLRDRDEKAALRDALETEYRQLCDAAAAVEASEKVVKDRYEQTLRSMNAAFTNSLKGIQAGVSVVTHFPVLEDL